jgi:hypothetical protein
MKSNLLDIIIASGLGVPIPKLNNYNDIPSKCFGVFITLKRSKYQTLPKWPTNIHGCIGYWNNDFNTMTKATLLDNIIKLSKQVTTDDSRKEYFNTIYLDISANYHITFMMKPLLRINPDNGSLKNGFKFNNKHYGIIAEDVTGNSATYLPNVFENKSWKFIKASLYKKANSSTHTTIFYAYQTIQYSKSIKDLFKRPFLETYFTQFHQFISKNYNNFIPYEVVNNKSRVDESQFVRNIASINDILTYDFVFKKKITTNIVNNLEFYKDKFNLKNKPMRQASAFLILALTNPVIQSSPVFIKRVCKYLYGSISNLEPKFELGEVLIALSYACPLKPRLLKEQVKMLYSLNPLDTIEMDDIFEYNWQAKFLLALYNNQHNKQSDHVPFKTHVIELVHRILKIKNEFITSESETNYLAVLFEALISLQVLIIKSNTDLLNQVQNHILDVFVKLNQRYRGGLFYWKNSKSARIDITCHILNGFKIFN